MRLTRVEIHGFKSFADRTDLVLPEGLTAIVGPNGCGKSNVIDAIKWALGEQKASALRGKEMTDVIFKGNGARTQRNFAEVSLVFDNADGVLPTEYAEVVLSRRLFRSGESEYLLNRQAVRLKDIRDLLMDTGLGTGAYSVMEQGRIDAVLSANATERRRIFEEAAGISRFRARKRECENKLKRAEQNLLRLGDVVEELEKRERSLKVQAGRARNFLAARDRARELRSMYYAHQWQELGATLAEQDGRLGELIEAEQTARNELDQARGEVGALQERLAGLRGEVDAVAEAFRRATGEVEALSERQASIVERLNDAADRRQVLEGRGAILQRALEERRQEAETVARRLEEVTAEAARFETDVARAGEVLSEAEAALQRWRDATAERRQEALERVGRLTEVRNTRSHLASRHAGLEASRERLASQVAELQQQIDERAARQGELTAAAEALEASLAAADTTVAEQRERQQQLSAELARLDEELAACRESLAAATSRREALEELIASRDGVSPGAVAVLEAGLVGVDGLVIDALKVPRELAEAVEAALGSSTQAVLVRTREDGLAALRHLAQVQGGRVQLVPSEGLVPRQGAALGERLLDRIQVLEHAPVFEALLGHVRLVPDREALAACAADGVTVWVTPAGELLDERGILRGGAAAADGGLVARRAELEELVQRCGELSAELEQRTERRRTDQDALAAAEGRLHEAQREARRLHGERDSARERERQGAERLTALQGERAVQAEDLQRVEQQLGSVAEELAGASGQEAELEAAVAEDRAEEQRQEQRQGELQAAIGKAQEELSFARLEHSARRERQEALEAERRQVQRGVEERQAEAAQTEQELGQLAERRQGLEAEQGQLAERAATLTEERDRQAGELEQRRGASAEVAQELSAAQERVLSLETAAGEAGDQLSNHRMSRQETAIRRDELRQKVLDELEIDLDAPTTPALPAPADEAREGEPTADGAEPQQAAAEGPQDGEAEAAPRAPVAVDAAALLPEDPESVDWAAIAAEIEELKQRMARIGNVNLEAVDELSEVEERLGFLVGQRDDLVEAGKSLTETIAKLNRESRERFVTAFDEVRGHFQKIFRKLFRGGKADIVLADDEDVLEAGIDITAAPPGKDARNITLLSGGERTLTAVGLLFALFRARPSPVCLLDEVDAALDETNIDRFCSVLEDFLGESQFVVVTHARRTMSYADQVFGVTMQEHGVSKVLSLTVEEYEQGTGAQRPEVAAALAEGPAAD